MILTRSPFYSSRSHPNDYVTSIDFEVKVGYGSTSSITALKTYNQTKEKYGTEDITFIDISPKIRDYFEFAPFDFTGTSAAEVITSNTYSVLLVETTTSVNDSLNSGANDATNTYIALDGFNRFADGHNNQPTKKILLSQTEYKADYRGYFIVPLFAESGDANPTIDGVEVTLGFSDSYLNYVKYLVIPCANYTGTIEVAFAGDTVQIEMVEECKYDVKSLQFINRYGCNEVMHFYKVKKDTLNIEFESFHRNLLEMDGSGYSTTNHKYKQFNKSSKKSFTMESGYLYESYNETIEELMLSEYVWLDRVPVNVNSKSLELKTRAVDKLISYNLEFEYAHDQISNV